MTFPTPLRRTPTPDTTDTLVLSCDGCVMAATPACRDCIVTYLCDGPGAAPQPVVIDHRRRALDREEVAVIRLLQGAGLAPGLRHAQR